MTDRELDVLVAEKVMGLLVVKHPAAAPTSVDFGIGIDGFDGVLPYYSTKIAAAWLVVEKMRTNIPHDSWGGFTVPHPRIEVSPKKDYWAVYMGIWYKTAKTAPLAICLAALRSKGVEIE